MRGILVKSGRDLSALAARYGAQRQLVALFVPDQPVGFAGFERTLRKHNQVQYEPPDDGVHLDDAPVGEELLQIAAHGPIAGGVRRAEIEEQHANAAMPYDRVAGGASAGAPTGAKPPLISFINRRLILQLA